MSAAGLLGLSASHARIPGTPLRVRRCAWTDPRDRAAMLLGRANPSIDGSNRAWKAPA